jgi:opacity protein-like surface antigen
MKMKKHIISIVILLLVMAQGLLAAEFQKPRFYIKFKGIGSLSEGGHFGDFVDLNEPYFTNLNNTSDSHTISVTSPAYFRGYGGEIGFDANKFAVGISVGYIEKTFHIDYHHEADAIENYTRDHTFSTIPIFLFVHYKIIDTRLLTTFLTIGEGVYVARYRDRLAKTVEETQITSTTSNLESKKNSLGFHIGATIDLNISANLALSIEAGYRLTNFKEMIAESYTEVDGTVTEEEGDFYYWFNRRTEQAQFRIGPPEDRLFIDGEPSVLNLNGFTLSIGIKITFGSKRKPKPVKVAPVDQ